VLTARLLAIVSEQNSAARSRDCCIVARAALSGGLLLPAESSSELDQRQPDSAGRESPDRQPDLLQSAFGL
jgi:hypothetical protein